MDWSRAKTILIVGYLVMNLVLGIRLVYDPPRQSGYYTVVSRAEVKEATENLMRSGLNVTAAVPRRSSAKPLILVRHLFKEEDAMAAILLRGLEEAIRMEGPGTVTFMKGKESVVIYENGVGVWTTWPLLGRPNMKERTTDAEKIGRGWSSLAAAQSWAAVEAFWEARGGFPPGASRDTIYYDPETGRYVVNYYQEFQGQPIFGSRISAVVHEGTVETLVLTWFEPCGPSGNPRTVISPTEALFTAARVLERFVGLPATVERIILGYYSEAYKARQWETVPVWMVRTTDGLDIYVNAYTGEPEGAFAVRQ